MKTYQKTIAAALAVLVMAGAAQATLYTYTFNSGFTGGTTITDGNATGWTDNRAISGIPNTGGDSDSIYSVAVHLNLSGGYNGDLYGYLVLTDTTTHSALGFSVLLNRVGTGSGSEPQYTFGYSTSGFSNVTLSDGAGTSIHDVSNPTGGTYATDGGSLASFAGQSANNTWTLFLADLSTGSTTTVSSWGLDIEVVPEPVTWAMIIFAGVVCAVAVRRRFTAVKA